MLLPNAMYASIKGMDVVVLVQVEGEAGMVVVEMVFVKLLDDDALTKLCHGLEQVNSSVGKRVDTKR